MVWWFCYTYLIMKKPHSGFIIPLLIAIIAVLVVGVVYLYVRPKTASAPVVDIADTTDIAATSSGTLPSAALAGSSVNPPTCPDGQAWNGSVCAAEPLGGRGPDIATGPYAAVSGMERYVDSTFGFSFWYPNDWAVQDQKVLNAGVFAGGTVTKWLVAGSNFSDSDANDSIGVFEVYAPKGLTIASSGPRSETYYFDASLHTWMLSATHYTTSVGAADVSVNTMGGLHMLQTSSVDFPTVIPLTASNFLVINDLKEGPTGRTDAFVKTIVATDPAVATPVSDAGQTQTVQAEKAAFPPSAAGAGNTSSIASAVSEIKKVICTLSGNDVPDNSNQLGLTFAAKGESCATLSGLTDNEATAQSVTFDGVTKTWRLAMLSPSDFSPDGKHFVYVASNMPLPQIVTGGDWKPERFVVADNVAGPTYDDIFQPQYSPDGQHLGYCAYSGGQYIEIIDGKQVGVTTKDDYYSACASLFGTDQSKSPLSGSGIPIDLKSPGGKYEIKTYFDPKVTANPNINCNMVDCPIYVSLTNLTAGDARASVFGSYESLPQVEFSPDGNHFLWATDGGLVIDGNEVAEAQTYNEIFNVSFSPDSRSVTFNARSKSTVYYIIQPLQ